MAQPIVVDPYAELLASTAPQHIAATRYIDDVLLKVMDATSVNRISQGDYRQVVLLGDGFDTRPFRMLWPQGTIIFLVAPAECHELAEAVLKQAGATVPRGCMLRRVNVDFTRAEPAFADELEASGFLGDRVSAWALQGLARLDLTPEQLSALLVDVSSLAAFHSLVLGELPAMARASADNMLADAGLLGTTVPLDGPETRFRERVAAESCAPNTASSKSASGQAPHVPHVPLHPWLFSTQQMRLSLAQIGTHQAFSAEYEGLDEDFIDNVS